jgi:DNA-binding MarR family transcriptional regulator
MMFMVTKPRGERPRPGPGATAGAKPRRPGAADSPPIGPEGLSQPRAEPTPPGSAPASGSAGAPTAGPPGRRTGNAFLLAQLGAHAAAKFVDQIAGLSLTPAQAGLLRLVAWAPGQSQQALAGQLGTPPSRLVLLVDGLQERGLIERRRNPDDRRHHALFLTEDGGRFLGELGQVGRAHEADLMTGLDGEEQTVLHDLLTRLAEAQGLVTGVHPGYRSGAEPSGDADAGG